MRTLHPHPRDPQHDSWVADLLIWAGILLIFLLNLVLMWRIATATV